MSTVHIHFIARPSGRLQRAPVLERLLARAAVQAVDDWRVPAFDAIAAPGEPLPAAASAAAGAAATGCAWVCVATPLHFVAGLSSLTLPDAGWLAFDADEARAFAAEFNATFGATADPNLGRLRLQVVGNGTLLCEFERALSVATHEPEDLLGADVYAAQPTGADAAPLRRLMSEIEMWLFEHALNRARTARRQLPVSALWLWGGGSPLHAAPAVNGWTSGADPQFAGDNLGKHPRDADTGAWVASARPGVWVGSARPGSPEWLRVEQHWLAPLAGGLRFRRIGTLQLSAAKRLFTLRRRDVVRIWRRPRPWWTWFDHEDWPVDGN